MSDNDRYSSSHTMSLDLRDVSSYGLRSSALYKLTDRAKLRVVSNKISTTGTGMVSYPILFCIHLCAFLVLTVYTIHEVDVNVQDRIGENTPIHDIASLVVELVGNSLDSDSNNTNINASHQDNQKVSVRDTGSGIAYPSLRTTFSTTRKLA
ncbi:hypothetical protein KCU98_g2015, partial [Aureobasidium melanogenum]